jgi:hypothetical protein
MYVTNTLPRAFTKWQMLVLKLFHLILVFKSIRIESFWVLKVFRVILQSSNWQDNKRSLINSDICVGYGVLFRAHPLY